MGGKERARGHHDCLRAVTGEPKRYDQDQEARDWLLSHDPYTCDHCHGRLLLDSYGLYLISPTGAAEKEKGRKRKDANANQAGSPRGKAEENWGNRNRSRNRNSAVWLRAPPHGPRWGGGLVWPHFGNEFRIVRGAWLMCVVSMRGAGSTWHNYHPAAS